MDAERTIRIKVDGDAKGLDRARRDAERMIQSIRRQVELTNRRAAQDAEIATRKAQAELDRTAKVVDSANRRFAGFIRTTVKLAGALGLLASSSTALSALGSTLVVSAGALVGLPGILAAAGVALATVKLGAAGAQRALAGVNSTLIPLKGQVATTFEQGLVPAVESLNRTLPQTAGGFAAIAREMAGVAEEGARSLELPRNTATLNSVLGRTSGLMSGVKRATGPLMTALLDVTSVGTSRFGTLGDRIAASSQEFAGFIARARESGQLRAWLDGGINALKTLWQRLRDIGGTVKGVFGGLSDGVRSVSGDLQPAVSRMREFVESTRGQAFLQRIGAAFATIGEAVGGTLTAGLDAALPLAGPLVDTLAMLAQVTSGFLVPVLNTVAPLLQTIANLIEDNQAVVQVLVGALVALRVSYIAVHGAIRIVTAVQGAWNAVAAVGARNAASLGTAFRNMGTAARVASLAMGAVGIAISLGAAVFSAFTGSSERAADAQRRLGEFASTVADEIEAQNGAMNENVRAVTASEAKQRGWADAAQKAGVSSQDLIGGLLGEEDARKRAIAVLDRHIAGLEGDGLVVAAQAAEFAVLRSALEGSGAAIQGQIKQNRYLADGTRETADAVGTHTVAVQANIDALTEQVDLLREAAGVVLSAREAESRYQAAVDAATQAVKDNGETLDLNTEKGRNNQSALDDVAKSTFDLIAAQVRNGASSQQLQATMERGRAQFVATANQMGLTEKQAEALATELGLIPGNYRANVSADTRGAMNALGAVGSALRALDGARATVTVGAVGNALGLPGFFSDFGGGRATGGPVVGGRTYLVGERGPELFRAPNTGGHIVPNHELAGQGGDTVVYVEIDGEQMQGRITRTVKEHNRATRRAVGAGTGLGR